MVFFLLYKLDNGKRIIEELFDNRIDLTFYGYDFMSKDILDMLIKRNRINLLYKGDISLLLSKYYNNMTYLDFMIRKEKEKDDGLSL